MEHHIKDLRPNQTLFQRRGLRLALYGGLMILSAIAVAATQDKAESGAQETQQILVTVATLTVEPEAGFERERRFVGLVEAGRVSAVGFESGGLLGEIQVDEGERIVAGAELARLDTARLEVQRAELVAAHKAEQAQLVLTQQTLKRRENLVEHGAASRQAVDEARERFRTALAETELARARIDAIDVDLAKSRLVAPFDAVVTRRFEDEGRVMSAGEPVLELQEQKRTEVRVGVAGPLVAAISAGQTRTLETAHGVIEARVKAVLPVRGAGTRTVDVILSLDEAHSGLRDGDLVTLRLSETVHEAGYWLPIDALAEGMRGLWTAYELQAGVTAQQLPDPDTGYEVIPQVVEILHAESDRVFVRGTLPPHALIIATGVHKVVPGQWVRPADENQQLAEGRHHDAVN